MIFIYAPPSPNLFPIPRLCWTEGGGGLTVIILIKNVIKSLHDKNVDDNWLYRLINMNVLLNLI